MTRTILAVLVMQGLALAAEPATKPAPADDALREIALKAAQAQVADATVERVRSNNIHLGGAREIVSPLPDWSFYCAKLGRNRFGDRVRQFLAVSRSREVIMPADIKAFAELVNKTDKTGWTDETYMNAAALFVHLTNVAHEDGWVILQSGEDFLKIEFNMPKKGPAAESRKQAARQIRKPTIKQKDGKTIITFDAWHLIGGKLRSWDFKIAQGANPGFDANSVDVGRFGGGGYD